MPQDAPSFFRAFYSAIADLRFEEEFWLSVKTSLPSEISNLDPIAATELVEEKLGTLHPDENLLSIYDAIHDYQSNSTGEQYYFDENDSLIIRTAEQAKRVCKKAQLSLDMLPQLIEALKQAISDRLEADVLIRYIDANKATRDRLHFKKLDEQVAHGSQRQQEEEVNTASGAFTHAQQAIAIHYLFHEALGLTNVDNTKLMEFAHLLSAKKIPINKETGKENIRNSGIKSAFNKAWKKEDANHLADLRFVLRFFKALNVDSNAGIQTAIAAIEKRIARISEKLNRDRD